MIEIRHEFDVETPIDRVWALLSDFDAFARCVPTLVEYKTTGADRATGVVGVVLGAIPVRSRVDVEITERKPPVCLRGRAVSYLGETVATQLREGRAGAVGASDVGRIDMHLDLRPTSSGGTRLVFQSEIHAEGKLARIYEAIVRLKAEGLKAEFERNVREALCSATGLEAAPKVLGWFQRLRAWLDRLRSIVRRVGASP